MAYKIIVTQKAEQDLDAILAYIVQELCNLPAAVKLMDAIRERYDLLAENPCMYPLCQSPILKKCPYRKAVLEGYLLIYRADDTRQCVYIERLFSQLEEYLEKL